MTVTNILQQLMQKGAPFPTEPMIMALLFSQHRLMAWLGTQTNGFGAHGIILEHSAQTSVKRYG